jgi:hypothetical protein
MTIFAYDIELFRLLTTVSTNPTIYGLLFRLEGKVQIRGPKKLRMNMQI